MGKDNDVLAHIEFDGADGQGGVYLKVTTKDNPVPQSVKLDKDYPVLTITGKRKGLFDRGA